MEDIHQVADRVEHRLLHQKESRSAYLSSCWTSCRLTEKFGVEVLKMVVLGGFFDEEFSGLVRLDGSVVDVAPV